MTADPLSNRPEDLESNPENKAGDTIDFASQPAAQEKRGEEGNEQKTDPNAGISAPDCAADNPALQAAPDQATIDSDAHHVAQQEPAKPPAGKPTVDSDAGGDQATVDSDLVAGKDGQGGARERAARRIPLATKLGDFGDYELLAEIARGGMGVVYKARHISLNRIVALKMILAGKLADERELQRFHAEVEAAAKLDHSAIVAIHEVGLHDGQHYFSMGFVDGHSLAVRLSESPLPPREAASLMKQVAEAIAYAHDHGVIHRDIKPANILLDRDGQPRITDFGLAKRTDTDSGITATGQILGTPGYMPPEQAAGKTDEIDPRGDVYALGATLYALLTGRAPFHAATLMETLRQVLERDPVSPRQLNSEVSRDLETICLKCLEKDPDRRYPSASALVEELGRYLEGEPIRARPISQMARAWRWCRRRPAIAATSLLLLLSLVVGGAVAAWLWRRAEGARDRAERALFVAREEKDRADLARREAQLMTTNLAIDRAVQHCQEGDVGGGLRWFARGLRVLPSGAEDLDHALRTNLNAWRQPLHSLEGRIAHDGPVSAAAFSPDGQLLVTGGENGTCRVWQLDNRQPRGPPLEQEAAVSDLAFSPDGRMLACGTRAGMVFVWDVSSAKLARPPLPSAGAPISAVTISGDGHWLATAAGAEVRIWDWKTGQAVAEAIRAPADITALAFHPQQPVLLTAADDGKLRFFDASTAQPAGSPVTATETVAVAFSPDGKLFATGHRGGFNARIWDTAGRRLLRDNLRHQSWVLSVAFSADGSQLFTGGRDGTARLWNVATGRAIGAPLQHDTAVQHVALHRDGRTAVTVSEDAWARRWKLGTALSPIVIIPQRHAVRAVTYDPHGKTILAGNDGGEVWHFDAASGKALGSAFLLGGKIKAVDFRPDGKTFLTAEPHAIRFWDATKHNPAGDVIRHPRDVIVRAVFSHDGTRIMAGTGEFKSGEALLWDADSGERVGTTMTHAERVLRVAFRWDDRVALTASEDRTARLWDLTTGRPLTAPMRHQNAVHAAVFRPDGAAVLTGDWHGIATMWDSRRGTAFGPTFQHEARGDAISAILAAAITPDGRTILTGSWDRTLRLWNAASGSPMGPPMVHSGRVYDLDLSPDGRTVVTGNDHNICQWRLPSPLEGSAEAIELWVELITNARLDDQNEVRILSGTGWEQRHEMLQRLDGKRLFEPASADTAGRRTEATRVVVPSPDDIQNLVAEAELLFRLRQWDEALARYSQLVERAPYHPEFLARRAILLARARKWKEAAADYERIIAEDLTADMNWLRAAPLHVLSGDAQAYRRFCTRMLAQFADDERLEVAERVAKACLLVPTSEAIVQATAAVAAKAVQDPTHWAILYSHVAHGLAHYRRGMYAEAIESCSKCQAGDLADSLWYRALDAYLIQAMAHHKLGHEDEAQAAMSQARRILEAHPLDFQAAWHDELICRLLWREARQCVESKPPDADLFAPAKSALEAPEIRTPDQIAAAAVLGTGTQIRLRETTPFGERTRTVNRFEEFPGGDWHVVEVAWRQGGLINDAILERLTQLPMLQSIVIEGANVQVSNWQLLERITTLRTLQLNDVSFIDDTFLETLGKLSGLKCLDLAKASRVDDRGLEHLRGLRQLESLDLTKTGITDAGLVHLSEMKQLQTLKLQRTRLTNAGLAHLQKLTTLCLLAISDMPITDEGLQVLEPLVNLEALHLNGTYVTGRGLQYLRGTQGLQSVSLHLSRTDDVGLKSLSLFPKLRWLDLARTGVTDEGLEHLAGLSELADLDLRSTRVTEAGVERLRQSIPRLKVVR